MRITEADWFHFFPASSYGGSSAGGGYMDTQRYSTGVNTNQPQNTAANPLLSHFDPLSSSSGGSYQSMISPRQQSGYGSGGSGAIRGGAGSGFNQAQGQGQGSNYQLTLGQPEIDAGQLIWHPRSATEPNTQAVTGFNGQTTIHVPIRGHSYTARDHPRTVIAQHRSELEQWDQYGWRQSLNSLESLRIAWETMQTDITRISDMGYPPHENAIVLKVSGRDSLLQDANVCRLSPR